MQQLSAVLLQLGSLALLGSAGLTQPQPAHNNAGALSRWLDSKAGYGSMSTPMSSRQIFVDKRQETEEAMCGKGSKGGSVKCGLDLCCSAGGWCGTTKDHCIGSEGSRCQEGFGRCEIVTPKSCGQDSNTANQRMIGYYQASNVRNRLCNRVYPKDIKTEGYTHLYWAFASINPKTFVVELAEGDDEQQLRDFAALGNDKLQTWVAIGGYDFSNAGTPTHTTWSDLCADSDRRKSFIESGKAFMDKYGFTGIDLDWEFPVAPERGGNEADVANLVLLVKEMKAAYGDKYRISMALPSDYWSLKEFDVKGLEPHVDHFGFMSYDMHGSFDGNGNSADPTVLGQADLEDIKQATLPLAYAGIDPAKVVLGMAFYGRGYTLADPTCNTIGCGFKGPSNPGKCTNSPGVLSLMEIEDMISTGQAKSRLNEKAAMKELVWDDQWVGYDDDESIALKRQFANDRCYGGIMAWSVDYNAGTGDSQEPPKSTDGSCGPQNGGKVCEGSGFGDCCSASGFCGSDSAYCGTDCISGKCETGGISTNGRCGKGFGDAQCEGSTFGFCCSAGSWCGSTPDHCGTGCQNGRCS